MSKMLSNERLKGLVKTVGPGILYAGAAIGGSHLVMSTQAGANFGFSLLWVIVVINLIKYPFFEFSYRYTATKGENVLAGYRNLGVYAIGIFFLVSLLTGIINFAAVTIVTAGLTQYFFQLFFDVTLDRFNTGIIILASILLIMLIGKYSLMDMIMKVMILVLAVATIGAFVVALGNGSQAIPGTVPMELWNDVGISFLLALMGWMPTPIEASVWPSLWSVERSKQTHYQPTLKESMFDFHLGYLGSAAMALFFLGLGALVMYGTGKTFASKGLEFSQQLVEMYSSTLGSWSTPVIAIIALITMFSTALTVIDGYPRSLQESVIQVFPGAGKSKDRLYWAWILLLSVSAIIIIKYMEMGGLLNFAMITAFLAAPVFAGINYAVIFNKDFPAEARPGPWLKFLSWIGIAFLVGFSALFVITRFTTLFSS